MVVLFVLGIALVLLAILLIGSAPSRTIVSIDWARERPAASEPDISCSVSGRCLLNALRRRPRLNPRYIHGPKSPTTMNAKPMSRLPPPSSRPVRPDTKKNPPCTSNHSEDLSSLPAPWSRALMRASRSLLRRSTFAAVSFAEAKVTSVSSSEELESATPPAAWASL